MSDSTSHTTTDHAVIRRWAQERGGRPATAADTEGGDDAGVLRFDFNEPAERVEEISGDQFFERFEQEKLSLVLQKETKEGAESRFSRFVRR